MINKLFPRVLNSSKDSRVRGAMEMKDALNVTVTSDYGNDFAAGEADLEEDGDVGVVKPALGNTPSQIKTFSLDSVFADGNFTRRVIGKVEDPKAGVIYFFVFSNNVQEMGVYAWDAYNYFGGGANQWRPIYCTPEFNFSDTGRVVGDIVHVSGGSDQDFRPILYFTDDENEPRKIDVQRCLEEGYTPSDFGYAANDVNDKDFITACPRSPVYPPTFAFSFDGSANRRSSDFRRVPGVQFAYQCIYAGGEESALSTYSDIAIPEEYLRQGTITGELNLPQRCTITIDPEPYANLGANTGAVVISEEVVAFKILVRRGNDGPFFIVDEVDRVVGGVTEYDFFNDKVLIGITESEENKQFDNLPKVAQALTAVENRLFFGNYIEGFDEVPFDGTVEPVYMQGSTSESAFELTATPIMVPISASATSTDLQGEVVPQRLPGVAIDTSSLPATLALGTSISVSFEFEPAKNLALYDVAGGYHNSTITGGVKEDITYNVAPASQVFDLTANPAYADLFVDGVDGNAELAENKVLNATGIGSGVGLSLQWQQTEGFLEGETSVTDVRIGTSAAAPLKIKGGQCNFSIELAITAELEDAPSVVAAAIGLTFSGNFDSLPDGIEVAQANVQSSYNYNFGLRAPNGDEDGRLFRLGKAGTSFNGEIAINVPAGSEQLDALDCITPVFEDSAGANPCPVGYVIVNEANVGMQLVHQPHMLDDPLGECILTLEVSSLTNVDVLTCVPCMTLPDLRVRQWRIYDADYLSNNQILDVESEYEGFSLGSDFAFGGTPQQTTSAVFHSLGLNSTFGTPAVGLDFFSAHQSQRKKVVGYLTANGGSVAGTDLFETNAKKREDLALIPQVNDVILATTNEVGTSMFDTEGGFQFQTPRVKGQLLSAASSLFSLQYENDDADEGGVSSLMILNGAVMARPSAASSLIVALLLNGEIPNDDAAQQSLFFKSLMGPSFQSAYIQGTANLVSYSPDGTSAGAAAKILTNSISPLFPTSVLYTGQTAFVVPDGAEDQFQEVEVSFNGFLDEIEVSGAYRSFKSSAYHDLGVVYYDDRGRPGNVNQLPRVYVAGYSNEERGNKGRVELDIELNSFPPPWAHQYQIVYAGNSTYQDFVQYSVAGAFVDEVGDTDTARNIYLSLNHLQSDRYVSYAQAFGAVDPNGNKDLYTFVPGDQVRVISFESEPGNTVFPNQLVFDVVDQVLLTGNGDAETEETRNPLDSGSGETPLFLRGSFLKLRNDPEATGFNWASVNAQGNNFSGALSNWSKRCIVEIVRPKAGADADIRSYQETGLVFNISRSGNTGVVHQTPRIRMRRGDVWWRRVPVNLQEYSEDTQAFVSLIPESQEQSDVNGETIEVDYQPRFRNRYLECRAFTDTFAGADVNGYGKRKFYSPEAAEVRRESSITYSDANDFSTRRVRFTSFNPFQAPFKDLPNQHGAINALVEFSEFVFVVQEDKASVVPINRNILADASGGDQLISSDKIIGKQKFIGGKYGADNNRESVVKVDESVYFAHKGKGEVYRFQGGKIDVIGRKGIAAQLYDAFQDVIFGGNVRVVSGYDPLKDEYIVSMLNIDAISYVSPTLFRQPLLQPFNFNETEDGVYNPNTDDPIGPPDDFTDGGDPGDGGGPNADVFDGAFDVPLSGFDVAALNALDPVVFWGGTWGTMSFYYKATTGGGVIYDAIQSYQQATWPADVALSDVVLGTNVTVTGTVTIGPGLLLDLSGLGFSNPFFELNRGFEPKPVCRYDDPNTVIGQLWYGRGVINSDFNNNGAGYLMITDPSIISQYGSNPGAAQALLWNTLQAHLVPPGYSPPVEFDTPRTVGDHCYVVGQKVQGNALERLVEDRTTEEVAITNAVEDLIEEGNRIGTLALEFDPTNTTLTNFGADIISATSALQSASNAIPYSSVEITELNLKTGEPMVYPTGFGYDYREIPSNAANQPGPLLVGVQLAIEDLQTVANSIDPNTLTDADSVFASMSATIDSLRASLDVVTNQLEEASSAPTVIDAEANTLIPNVQSSNDNFSTLGALAVLGGSGTAIEPEDVQSANVLAQQLEFLSSNGIEITGDLLRQLLGNLEQSFRDVSSSLLSTIDADQFTVDGLQLARANTTNLADLDISGTVGSSDLLVSLGQYGQFGPEPISEAEYIDLTNNIASSYNG